MQYTAGELRNMNGRKCRLQYDDKPEAEGEIYIKDWGITNLYFNIILLCEMKQSLYLYI